MVNDIKKPKTETLTFRLDKAIINRLRQEAGGNRTTLNTLANQIFREHVDWYSNAPKAGYISIPRDFVIELLNLISEQEIIRISEKVTKGHHSDIILLLRDEYDVTSTLDVIETWIRISGYRYKHEVSDDGGGDIHRFVIHHNMGRKWSLYISTRYQTVFDQLGLKRVEFALTENTVAFKVDIGGTRSGIMATS